jgi:uncharacterized protein (DUF2062 family)
MPGYFHRRVTSPFFRLISQGITPRKLALSLALGFCISCFPVFGATTILCMVVAFASGLNLPAILFANCLALPLQLVFLVPLMRLGEWLFNEHRPLPSIEQMMAIIRKDPAQLAKQFWSLQWHAVVAWALVAPVVCLLLTPLLRELVRWIYFRFPNARQRKMTLPGTTAESLPSDVAS